MTPLPRFVARDNLIFYVDFDGLDAHSEAWQKTAAYKMLNQTPLGTMLEELAARLLDKFLEIMPNHKFSGAEAVTLVKHMARKGWVLALNSNQKGANPFVGTFVLRGTTAPKDKEIKSISSRLIGTMMGPDPKLKIEHRAGRVLVVVQRGTAPQAGWVWWAEKDDLVIGFMQPSDSDAIMGVLDGKTPAAAEHANLKALASPEGSFVPLMTAIIDFTAVPAATATTPRPAMFAFFDKLKTASGASRLDYRWGFDDDALMSVTRLTAPAPRNPALAMFDQPPLDTKELIPMPEGVESFVTVSLSPAKVFESINQIGAAGELKEKLDELVEKVRSQTRIDFDKDFLANIGPKMAIYLSPGRSAVATDEAPQPPAGPGGFDPMAMLSSLQGALPKPTLVAELRDPVTFGKALDAIMLTVNKELKAEAMEKAAEEEKAGEAGRTPGQGQAPNRGFGRGPGGSAGPGGSEGPGGRLARKHSLKDTLAPEFRLMPGDTKIYMLRVPTDSPLKLVPPGMHPTIRMEGKHVAFASTSEAARAGPGHAQEEGMETWAGHRAGSLSSPARAHLPGGRRPEKTVPSLLASLPGTLQAQINAAIAMSGAGVPGAAAGGAAPGQPGAPTGFGSSSMNRPGGSEGSSSMNMSRPGGRGGSGPPGSMGPMSMSRRVARVASARKALPAFQAGLGSWARADRRGAARKAP